jgi:hypothetical protein
MHYSQLKLLQRNRDAVFGKYNSADGTTNDTSTDPVITRDPNNYLVPKVNGFTIVNTLTIVVAVLAVVILFPMAIKAIKQYGISIN